MSDKHKISDRNPIDENYTYNNDLLTNLLELSEVNDIEGLRKTVSNEPNLINVINNGDLHGFTPLLLASSHGSSDCLKLLISSGANVNKSGNGGRCPLHYAVMYFDEELVNNSNF